MTSPPSDPTSSPVELSAQKFAIAAARNVVPIQEVLAKYLPGSGRVLEIASGTGQHIVAHGAAFPKLTWQPTDQNAVCLASIDAFRHSVALDNVLPAAYLDVSVRGWGRNGGPVAVVLMSNLLHLITEADMAVVLDEAHQCLAPGGLLAIYGPFLRQGMTTSPGDADFHAELLAREEGLGYKDLGVVASVLEALQMRVTTHSMPANNVMLMARKPEPE